MRLTCPNCRAQYEIDGSAIPEGGRDVQCSACGTTWFQPPETLDGASSQDDAAEPSEPSRPAPTAAAPRIDQSVLDVLREEAERELTERRRSTTTGLETQGDLGLVSRPRVERGARRPEPQDTGPADHRDPPDRTTPEPAEKPTSSRRNLLPDIDELSSTLQPGNTPRRTGDAESSLPPPGAEARSGFVQGLLLAALVAVILLGLYLLAPLASEYVPVLSEPLAGYVALVDSVRLWIVDTLRDLVNQVAGLG
ncbi:MAG: zinc-ribbon domain [Rhodobacteraceae bacterium HLUCCA12]|nr:MAG: zinc-ribbon domain [Rhodobacteraceae bacterium HLUCCA12]